MDTRVADRDCSFKDKPDSLRRTCFISAKSKRKETDDSFAAIPPFHGICNAECSMVSPNSSHSLKTAGNPTNCEYTSDNKHLSVSLRGCFLQFHDIFGALTEKWVQGRQENVEVVGCIYGLQRMVNGQLQPVSNYTHSTLNLKCTDVFITDQWVPQIITLSARFWTDMTNKGIKDRGPRAPVKTSI